MYGDEQVTYQIGSDGDTDEEYGKCLKGEKNKLKIRKCKKCFLKPPFSHQSLVFEGVVDTSEEEPERPEVLEAKVHKVVGQQHQTPENQKFDVD